MSDPNTNDILAAINKLVEAQTFSVQATEAIAKLREKAAGLELQLASSKTGNETLSRELESSRAWGAGLLARVEKLDAREKVLAAREEKVTELEKAAAVANGKIEAFREVTGLVFRNVEMRREMMGMVPHPINANPSYYPPSPTVPVSESVKETQA